MLCSPFFGTFLPTGGSVGVWDQKEPSCWKRTCRPADAGSLISKTSIDKKHIAAGGSPSFSPATTSWLKSSSKRLSHGSSGRWSAIKDRDAVRSYLRRSVVNLAQKSWRKRTNERAYLERHAAGEQNVAAPPDFETRDELQELLRKLPFRQQAAIVLRYYEDLPEREIARLLGCALGTVKSALARGLDAMKIELEGDSNE
ncbi:MAG: sigma-70 family RNA polymerase sigma factor [Actinomycetota bacterium]|nr:sigma-70 family RNA polymerase sigma factor [Actinomycetota bacterium]